MKEKINFCIFCCEVIHDSCEWREKATPIWFGVAAVELVKPENS